MSADPPVRAPGTIAAAVTTGGRRFRNRLTLGVGAIVTLSEACALLPVCDREARAWLRSRGLVRDLEGRVVVRWLDVLDALDVLDPSGASPAPLPPRLPREKLTPI